jgi:hypothetical protein
MMVFPTLDFERGNKKNERENASITIMRSGSFSKYN